MSPRPPRLSGKAVRLSPRRFLSSAAWLQLAMHAVFEEADDRSGEC